MTRCPRVRRSPRTRTSWRAARCLAALGSRRSSHLAHLGIGEELDGDDLHRFAETADLRADPSHLAPQLGRQLHSALGDRTAKLCAQLAAAGGNRSAKLRVQLATAVGNRSAKLCAQLAVAGGNRSAKLCAQLAVAGGQRRCQVLPPLRAQLAPGFRKILLPLRAQLESSLREVLPPRCGQVPAQLLQLLAQLLLAAPYGLDHVPLERLKLAVVTLSVRHASPPPPAFRLRHHTPRPVARQECARWLRPRGPSGSAIARAAGSGLGSDRLPRSLSLSCRHGLPRLAPPSPG